MIKLRGLHEPTRTLEQALAEIERSATYEYIAGDYYARNYKARMALTLRREISRRRTN